MARVKVVFTNGYGSELEKKIAQRMEKKGDLKIIVSKSPRVTKKEDE